MAENKFVIVTNAPREYVWKDSYQYNLSGQTDITEKVADNPRYRKGELCLMHPRIISFYKKHKTSFEEAIRKGVTTRFPNIIDKTVEYGGLSYLTSFPEGEIPALICETEVNRGTFREEQLKSINAEYIIIPLKTEEFAEVNSDNLEEVLKTYERNNQTLTPEDKSKIRQKLAVLKSFDIYLNENAVKIQDIPIEITKRAGEIDRASLRKYTA